MKHPLIIERPDLQSRTQRTLYTLITLLAWGFWMYLLAPLLSLAAWAVGIHAFFVEMLLPQNLNYLRELLLYAAVLLSVLISIVAWSQYNLYRFRGADRRAAPQALNAEDEAAFYELDLQSVSLLKQARVATVFFDEQHRLKQLRPQHLAEPAPAVPAAAPTGLANSDELMLNVRPLRPVGSDTIVASADDF
jgi:biofilm PGA synthesis protein PgaD